MSEWVGECIGSHLVELVCEVLSLQRGGRRGADRAARAPPQLSSRVRTQLVRYVHHYVARYVRFLFQWYFYLKIIMIKPN